MVFELVLPNEGPRRLSKNSFIFAKLANPKVFGFGRVLIISSSSCLPTILCCPD
jgi:hypothetical protein